MKGNVINFGSGSGLEGQKTQTANTPVKEAIRAISKVAANEWRESMGLPLTLSISPIAMSLGEKAWKEAYPEMYQEVLEKIR
ncbi:hypothetical protein CQJ30_05655 [Caldibacillus thermoamylovorans]|nr:hypothetical protein CQJ30_05655 [Caldibacillus thermoamylovorans]